MLKTFGAIEHMGFSFDMCVTNNFALVICAFASNCSHFAHMNIIKAIMVQNCFIHVPLVTVNNKEGDNSYIK